MSAGTTDISGQFAGRRVALVGRLAGMPRRAAESLVRLHGGTLVDRADGDTDFVVAGDDSLAGNARATAEQALAGPALEAWQAGRLKILAEAELWTALGLVDADDNIKRLYTPALLAELVRVPVRAVRHWHRRGHLRAERCVGRLPYFPFEQVRVAQRLAALLAADCTLAQIDRKLRELARQLPEASQPLAGDGVVVVGRKIYRRHGEQLVEPHGQTLLAFDAALADARRAGDDAQVTIPISAAAQFQPERAETLGSHELRDLADEFEQCGEMDRAMEVYRSVLMSGDFTADDHFALAELLYRSGDLAAARERYYSAIELDETFVEARANLGCLLVEQGEDELAEAAFRGALACHGDFADAHYHLARLLDARDQPVAASFHWQRFLELAPASPWAEEALDRTGASISP